MLNLSLGLALTTIPVLVIIYMIWAIGHNMGQHAGVTRLGGEMKQTLAKHYAAERMKLLAQGEKVGYEKGLEAGKLEARESLRVEFILFLEEQVRILKNPPTFALPITHHEDNE